MIYVLLAVSIAFEVLGTSLMPKTEGFTRWPYTVALLVCYAISFLLVSQVVRELPVGLVYATWSATGIVLVSAVGYFVYNQKLDLPGVIGVGLIVAGVLILNLLSKTQVH